MRRNSISRPNLTIIEILMTVTPILSPQGFELFVVPPKRVLGDAETLLDAGCVPTALVHISSAQELALRAEALERLSNPAGAQKAIADAAIKRPGTGGRTIEGSQKRWSVYYFMDLMDPQ